MATDPTPGGQFLIYRDGDTRLQVRLEGRTVWLSQRLIAELFQVSVKTVNEHLVNIYDDGELDRGPIVRSFRIVQAEGRLEAGRPVSDFDQAVEAVKRLESGATRQTKPGAKGARRKPPQRRKRRGGRDGR